MTRKRVLIALFLYLPFSAFAATPETTVLDVQNMTCSMRTVTIRKALEPGVIEAKVDYGKKTATVKYDAHNAKSSSLVKATTDAGFPSKLHVGAGN